MADFNSVHLIGRCTRDPQLRFLPGGSAVCDFGLAVGRKFKTAAGEQREEKLFVDCTLFGKGGEIFNQYMGKGKPVFVSGRLKLDEWTDKTSGQKRSKIGVVVDDFQFLDSKGGNAGSHDRDPPHGDSGAESQAPGGEQQPAEDLPW